MTTAGAPDSDPNEAVPHHLGEVIVEARGIEKYFGAHHVLRGVDLDVRRREAVMLIGRSGSGKTTLLRCLNFLEEPTVGIGRDRRPPRRGRPAARQRPARTGSRSARSACAPACSSRTSTSSRT